MTARPGEPGALGAHFTPLRWARWAVDRCGVFAAWLDGASVLDPTAGQGSFLEALIATARAREVPLTGPLLARLWGIEREARFVGPLRARLRERYQVELPERQLLCADVLTSGDGLRADLLVGNPPWMNYCDLPPPERERYRPLFVRHGLAARGRALHLGASRVDLAALIVVHAMSERLHRGGAACFFLPLSLLLNDGAHRGFCDQQGFSVTEVWDFAGREIFEAVATRYGLVRLQRDRPRAFPVPFHVWRGGRWVRRAAHSLDGAGAPLWVGPARGLERPPAMAVPAHCRPRQGINSCGAPGLFLFDEVRPLDEALAVAKNAAVGEVELPRALLYPVATRADFGARDTPDAPDSEGSSLLAVRRHLLLPHDPVTGRPLEEHQLRAHLGLWRHLTEHRAQLSVRRGTLIRRWIDQGYFWALLGVGPYCFAPWRVMWPALGQRTFSPRLFGGRWQGNQAQHAFIPLPDRDQAERLLGQLSAPSVERYLRSFRMEGTCNWAQPGRIARLLSFS